MKTLLRYGNQFKFKVKKIIPLIFALSVMGVSYLAWGWGVCGCSGLKDKVNQATKTEQVKETDA